MPIAMGFVLVLAFALLLFAFRSLVIAAKAIVLNLLSVAAAFGLLVAVFQWGWGENLLGFESTGAIIPGLPLFMFVVLFGLSMDYHVFILTRVREAYDRGLSNAEAVTHGIKSSAAVVTAAAFVMVAVFSIFLTLSSVSAKQFGFGLAAAILIDATIVRAVLLPATMKLFGDWNWYLPSWLQWLPRLEHERSTDVPGDSTRGGTQGRTGSIRIAVPPWPDDPYLMNEFATDAPQPKRLHRNRSDRVLAGVSGGLGRYFEIHPAVFRVAFVVLTLLGGAGILIYLAAALVMPDDGKQDSIVTAALRDRRHRPWPLIGVGLVAAAGAMLLSTVSLWPHGDAWVFLLIAGAAILWITRYGVAGGVATDATDATDASALAAEDSRRVRRLLRRVGIALASLVVLLLIAVAVFVAYFDVHFGRGIGERSHVVANQGDLRSDYRLGIGDLRVDLSSVALPVGETHLETRIDVGELRVIVPDDVALRVRADAELGEIDLLGETVDGHDVDARLDETGARVLVLDAHVGVGALKITRASG